MSAFHWYTNALEGDMQNITVGRYSTEEAASSGYAGWIEGQDAAGESWILFLDDAGRPQVYFAHRDEDGGVTSDPVPLD